MITVISLSKDVQELPEVIANWNEASSTAQEFMLSGTHFSANSQELLIYNERQIIASCSCFCFENGSIEIENCWTKQGNIF